MTTATNSPTGKRLIAWAAGTADRVIRTFVQTIAGYAALVLQGGGHDFNWTVGLSMAALAAVVSVLTQFLAIPSFGETWVFQAAERAAKTFVQVVIAGIGTNILITDVDWDLTVNTAWIAALASLGTSALTTNGGFGAGGQVDLVPPPPPSRSAAVERAPRS